MKKYFNKTVRFAFAVMLSLMVVALPESSHAFSFETALCTIFDCFLGDTIIGVIGTIAVIFLGIGAFFGKVNWGLAITVAVGIVVIAGASQIVDTIAGGTIADCAATC